jgi:hypothetical protein
MKNYTSLSSSPNTSYMQFNDSGNMSGSGSGCGSPGSLGGWADNTPFKRFETYMTNDVKNKSDIHQKLQSLPISQSPPENYKHSQRNAHSAHQLYTSEDIINLNNNKSFPNSPRHDDDILIILPFYIPIIDIVIANSLHVEIVDHSSKGGADKNNVICSGKIRKYRLNGTVKNYDIFVEIGNENVYHVKKRGIMMRVHVKEELRQLIIKTMVNYVADGGDIDPKNNSAENSTSASGGGGGGGASAGAKRAFSCFGCFKS